MEIVLSEVSDLSDWSDLSDSSHPPHLKKITGGMHCMSPVFVALQRGLLCLRFLCYFFEFVEGYLFYIYVGKVLDAVEEFAVAYLLDDVRT